MSQKDGRKVLRAKKPDGTSRIIQVHLDPPFYVALYWMSFHRNQSLAETIRDLIHAEYQREGF